MIEPKKLTEINQLKQWIRVPLVALFLIISNSFFATDYFWIGNSGSWNDSNHWSLSSGGNGGAGVPTINDNAFFDASSFTANSLVQVNSVANCKNLVWEGTIGNHNLSGTAELNVKGDFIVVDKLKNEFTGNINLLANSGTAIIKAGEFQWFSNILINGGATFSMLNDFGTLKTNTITLRKGTFNTNNFVLYTGTFKTESNKTKYLDLGTSTVKIFEKWDVQSGSNFNLEASNSSVEWDEQIPAADILKGNYDYGSIGPKATCSNGIVFSAVVSSNYNGSQISCNGSCDAQITVEVTGGLGGPYGYELTDGTITVLQGTTNGVTTVPDTSIFTALCAGTYNITVYDSAQLIFGTVYESCTEFGVVISAPAPIGINVQGFIDPTCPSSCDGTIFTSIGGGTGILTITWPTISPFPFTGEDPTNACTGTHTVNVIDINGCFFTADVTVTDPPPILPNLTIYPVSCNNVCNGSIMSAPVGGNGGPFTFVWDGGLTLTSDSATGLCELTTYTVTVTDVNGCTQNGSATVPDRDSISIVAVTPVNPTCFGLCNGQLSILLSGGSGTYTTVDWYVGILGGGGTPFTPTSLLNSTNLCANTNYKVVVTDDNGCQDSLQLPMLSQPNELILTETHADLLCNGDGNGSINITTTGGTAIIPAPNYTYQWTVVVPGSGEVANAQNQSTLAGGDYQVVATDAQSCTDTLVISIFEPDQIYANGLTVDNACYDSLNASINQTVSGGMGPGVYTFTWTYQGMPFAPITEDLSGLDSGTYFVSIVDTNLCQYDTTYTIITPGEIFVNGVVTPVACNGGNTGAISITPVNGVGNYVFDWSHLAPAGYIDPQNAAGLSQGSYTVSIRDDNGCVKDSIMVITEPAPISFSETNTPITCFGASDGTITLTISGGSTPYTTVWAGTNPMAIANNTLTPSGLTAGTYDVTVTDNNGCSASLSILITEPVEIILALNISDLTCAGVPDGAINLTVTGGTGGFTFDWDNNGTGAFTDPQNIAALSAGGYCVSVRDNTGCQKDSCQIPVVEPDSIFFGNTIVTPGLCFGVNTSAIDIFPQGGTTPPGYLFAWTSFPAGFTSNSQNISNLAPITYFVTVQDVNGCTNDTTISFSAPTQITGVLSSTNSSCGVSNGSVTAVISGGAGDQSYSWTGPGGPYTGATVNGLGAGTYDLTYTDLNGCTYTDQVIVNNDLAPTATFTTQNLNCFQICNGSITTVISGGATPYNSVIWTSTDATFTDPGTASLFTLCAADYTLTVTDANNCIFSQTLTINEPPEIVAGNVGVTNVQCFSDSSGAIDITPGGGSGLFTYNWVGPGFTANTQDISNIPLGTYCVRITDINSCFLDTCVDITEPTNLTLTFTTNPAQCTLTDGDATVIPSGGTLNYSYLWPSGGTLATEPNLGAGTYMVYVNDGNTCQDSILVTVSEDNGPTIVLDNSTDATCNGVCDGDIQTTVTGLNAFGLSWSNGSVVDDISALCAGTYILTATDSVTGCQVLETVVIAEPAIFNVPGTVNDAACFGGTGSISLSPIGGTAPYNFNWDNDGTNDPDADPQNLGGVVAGVYNVLAYDINGCTTAGNFTINEPTEITAVTSNTPTSACGLSDGSVSVVASNGTPGVLPNDYFYTWTTSVGGNNVGNTTTVSNLSAGCYDVAVLDGAGCTVTFSECIIDGGAVPLVATPTDVTCFGANDGIITVTLSGQDSLVWSGPQAIADDTNPANGLIPGTYTATLTDNGCVSATTVDVLEPLEITMIPTLTNPPCVSAFTGSISLVINDAIGATSTSWIGPNGFTANTTNISALEAGQYCVTITDVNGCQVAACYDLFDNPTITLVTANVPTSCTVNTGEVSVVVSGGVVAVDYTYNWDDSSPASIGATATITGLGVDTYTVTVTDDLGCTATATENIVNAAGPVVTLTNVTNVSCFGANDGGIFVSVSAGTLPYTYSWDSGATTEDLSPQGPGTYILTVLDGAGCTGTLTDVIIEPAVLMVTGSVDTDLTCNGDGSGAINITVTGGTLAYAFSWSDQVPQVFSTNEDVNGLSGGTFDVVVTDANGCVANYSTTLIEPTALVVTSGVQNSTCLLSDGSASVTGVGGTGAYTYNWEDVANPSVSIGTNDTLFNQPAGSYEGFVIDANGCSGSLIVPISDATGPSATSVITNVICFGNANGAIDLTVTESPLTYVWTGPAPFVDPGTEDLTGLEAGSYTVLITNSTGCSSSQAITVGGPTGALTTTVITTDLTCFNDASGALDVTTTGGTPSLITGYTFAWSGPNGFTSTFEDITALDSGAYTLTVTDSNICNYTVTYNVTQTDSLALNATAVDATCGIQDGSISTAATGGDGNYTYAWSEVITGPLSPGTNSSENALGAGVYQIIITDGAGCTTADNVPLSDANAAPLTTIVTNVTCNGDGNGGVNLTVNGPNTYSFVWTGAAPFVGATTEDISGLSPGTYNVQVTDNTLGCISVATVNVVEPQVLAVTGIENNVSCFGVADGNINITVTGGTTAYTFSWTGPNGFTDNQEDATLLDVGTYQVTVTDANSCQTTAQFAITQPNTMTVSAIIVDDACFQGGNGSIDITVAQGSTPYTYLWTYPDLTTSNNEDITNLGAGTYNLSILDVNSCQKDTFFIITETPQLIANVVVTNANCTFSDGSAISTTSGGVGPYSYSWAPANPSVTNSIINVPSGVYPLQIIDFNNCQFDTTVTINDIGGPTITVVNVIDVSCFGLSNGGVDVTVAGVNPPFTYLWNPNAISQAEDLFNAPAGIYTYQVTDALGCNSFETATINSPADLAGTYTTVDATCGLCNGDATIAATGGTGAYSYIWSDNQTTVTATNLCAGVQTVQITDANNCVANVDVAVSNIGGPTGETITTTDATCAGGNDGAANVTPIGGVAPYSYFWPHNGSTANPISSLAAGNYFVEISDANGCTRVAEIIITDATAMSTIAQVTPSTCGGNDGAIATTTTGGSGTYTYSWSGGLSSITAQSEGVYSVTINDGNCSITETYTIPGSGAAELTLSPTNTNCFNTSDGSITSTVSNNVGFMSYQWYSGSAQISGETTTSISNLTAGSYVLEGLDAGTGCYAYATIDITSPDSIVLSLPTIIDASCASICDGDASVVVSGGTLPYSYVWSQNASVTNNAAALCAGADTVTVTDVNSCVISTEVIVNEPMTISIITDSVTDAFCVNTNDGEILITANGGNGNYSYSWVSIPTGFVSSSEDLTGLYPMEYVITVTDGNGCNFSDSIPVDTLNVLVADAGVDSAVCAGSCIDLVGAGSGTNTFTLEWFNSSGVSVSNNATFQLCPLIAGLESYILVITDAQCSGSDTVGVSVNPLPIVDAGQDYYEIYGTLITLGGSPTSNSGTVLWSPTTNFTDPTGTEPNPELSLVSNLDYIVTAIDSNGCVSTDTVNVEIFPEITFPNGFSPNNDGVNDTWQIDNMIQFPDAVVEVYNRWGQQLFISVGYVQQFDGTYKGKDLPVGTYYYIIVLNHPEYPDAYTGPITIMR